MQRLFLFLCLFAISLTTQAQFGALRKAKNRLLDKVVERTVDKAADRVADKLSDKIVESFDDLFNEDGTPKMDADGNPKIGVMGMLQGPPDEVLPNPQVVSFHMTSVLSEGKDNGTIEVDYAFETWKTGIHMHMEHENNADAEMKMYYDLEEKKSTVAINNDGEWNAFRTWMPNYSVLLEADSTEQAMEVTLTGNTKTIMGYPCKEYAVSMENGTGTVWVTEDININLFALYQSMGVFGKQNKKTISRGSNFEFEEGFWLESNLTMNDGTKVHSQISDIRMGEAVNRVPFDLSGIPISYDLTTQQTMMDNGN